MNKAYSEGPSDTKAKEGKKGGMKNVDGRLKGSEFNSQVKVGMADELVGNTPNEGAPALNKGKKRPGLDAAAY